MIQNPIYQPKGAAREYGELALNHWDSCNHGCIYCFAKQMYERYHPGKKFGDNVQLRPGIFEATEKQLKTGKFEGRTVFLNFMCDPYPAKIDTTPTREIIKLLKNYGAHVQILTKGGDQVRRDFDLLDSGDWFGITLTCNDFKIANQHEPGAAHPLERAASLYSAGEKGIKTWISFEPVLDPDGILELFGKPGINLFESNPLIKIGKLNHHKNDTDWKSFGIEAERICKENGWNYYIKNDLRREMEK